MKQWIACLVVATASPALAWDCEYERRFEEVVDLSGSTDLLVVAAAGDLEIRGKEGLDTAVVKARACASKQAWVDETRLEINGGDHAQIATVMPDIDWNTSWSGNRYAWMDLVIEVPANLPLNVRDSSGDVEISGVESVGIRDSSGNIDISDVAGDVELEDSSGDIDLASIGGNVTVRQDSSGDIRGHDVEGSVLIARDSSGDIRFRRVGQDFIVERDSSGDIVAHGVGGDFRVLRDGSGDIDASDVTGEIAVPDKG